VGTGWNEHTGAGTLDVTAAVALAGRYDLVPPALTLQTDDVAGGVRVRASAPDATDAGRELAGGVSLGLEYSYDGRTYQALMAPGAAAIDLAFAATRERPLWIRAGACDANRNCADRAAGPFTGASAAGAAPPAGTRAGRTRVRGSIVAFGLGSRCRSGRRCVRLVWRAGPAALRGVRYSLEVRHQGTRALLARARGSAAAGRRHALVLVPRRRVACGRVVARLTLRTGTAARTIVRRAAVRRGCPRGR
jgi:hypothetical protein